MFVLGGLFLFAGPVFALCTALTEGLVVIDTKQCQIVNTQKMRSANDPALASIRSLSPQAQKEFYGSYEGKLLHGRIVKSDAIQKGFDETPGALNGQQVKVFIPDVAATCESLSKRRLSGKLSQVCCDGGLDSPCALGTSYRLVVESDLGKAGSAAGDQKRVQARKSKEYRAAVKLMRKKNYQQAVQQFMIAKEKGYLDPAGHFLAAMAYRRLDQCDKALTLLESLTSQKTLKTLWADQEKMARRALFLQARCLAKINKPDRAVVILNGYLLEPKRYKKEIQESLRHPDFGFIHTSDQYQGYKRQAQSLGF